MILLLNLVLFIYFAAIAAATILIPKWTSWAFINCSYYVILILVATWAFSLLDLWQEKRNTLLFIKTHRNGIIFSFVLASLIFISVPHYFRILSDETNTLSVAKSLTFTKKAENVTEGKWYYEMFWPSNSTIDKRPLLFPFFVSLFHSALGYRPENAFLLNYFALGISFFLLYLLIRSSLSEILAFASILLVMSQPFMSLTATSTSFEIFNLLFILSSFVSLKYFINNPDRKYFTILCLNLLMLANVRYESFIFLAVIMVCLGFFRYIRLEFFKQSAVYTLMLFLFLPLIWQRVIYSRIPDIDMPHGLWIKAFSFDNLFHNLTLFFKYTLNLDGHLGFAGVVNWMGLAAVCFWVIAIFVKKSPLPKKELALLVCSVLSILAFSIIIFFYDQARMTQHPLNGRLYMPLLVALSILPIYALNDLIKNNLRISRLLLVGALFIFIFYQPIAEEGRLENQLISLRDFRYVLNFLNHHSGENILLVYSRPGQFVVYNYGAISFSTANNQKDTVMEQYRNRLFNKIYVVQEISYETKTPFPSDVLDPSYNLQTVSEIQSGTYLLRISEVVSPS